MGLKYRRLRRRASKGGIDGPLELRDGIGVIIGSFRGSIIDISTAEIDVSRRIRYFLTGALFLDEASDIFFHLATF